MALVLLVVGGLSMLDVHRLGLVDPGFDEEGVIAYRVDLSSDRYAEDEDRVAFVENYLAELKAIPGIEDVAVASSLPLGGHWGWFFMADGAAPRAEDEGNPVVLNRVVTPDYFQTLGVEFVAGRPFDAFDGREGSEAIIVNETFVRTHLGHVSNPIGARVAPGTDEPGEDTSWYQVVGVTRDVKHYGVDEAARPGVYQPFRQVPLVPLNEFHVVMRTRGDAATIVSAVRTVTAGIDVELPVFGVETMSKTLSDSLFTRRATSWLIAAFAAIALLLAMAGIYGVIAYSVGQRTREISIRLAMGAQKQEVLRQVLRQGMLLVAFGIVAGLGVSMAGASVVSGILVGVNATEPVIYVGVTALLVVVAFVANYLPARRAASVDPMDALRGD